MARTTSSAKTVERRTPEWRLQDAKARFSELYRQARESGPQRITRHGKEPVVVLREEDYLQLTRTAHGGTLSRFFATSPLAGIELEVKRKREYVRTIEL